MANGKVCTGFSMPWVALYAESNGTVTYSGGRPLARGVDVTVSIEADSDNNFYADNVLAESDRQAFSSGTLSLTVDGLKEDARKMLSGVQNTVSVTVGQTSVTGDAYDIDAVIPYVGVGFVVRYMEDGVTSYAPIVIKKVKFDEPEVTASTQTESIDWQTQSLEGTIMRDDSAKHQWKIVFDDQTTEEAAYDVIKAVLTPAT